MRPNLLVLFISVLATTSDVRAREKEPTYEGKSIADWIARMKSKNTIDRDHGEAVTMLSKIGTRAVPALI